MYDIGIIGAGPAGATLARLLADRYRVLLLDSGRQKCCGGILSNKAQKVLAKLDLAVPEQVRVDPQPSIVTIMDWDNRLVQSYPRQYVNIDRTAFDRWLVSLIPQTVDIRSNTVYQKSDTCNKSFTLYFKEHEEPKTAQVRWLIGADGAFSTVRREFFPNVSMPKRYIAVQHWFEQDAVTAAPQFSIDLWNDYTGIFDSAMTDYYMWMIPKNQQLILGGAFPWRAGASSAMHTVKEKLKSLGLRLETPFKREAGQILRSLGPSTLCFGDARTILVGEASGLISSSSAEGISRALLSAFYLAESFPKSGFDPSLYRRLLWGLRWSFLPQRMKILPMFNPQIRKYVILSGLMALRQ